MTIMPARAFSIKNVDGQNCLVNTETGRVVFTLHFRDADIEMHHDGVVMLGAKFVCGEPDK